ncbi:MAG: hypothetical protein FWF73_05455 [Spirochaetes bacterium]|nr:hypothetical protein [Spirochaetota bacterium]
MKRFLTSFFVIIPIVLFSQDKSSEVKLDIKKKPVLSLSSKVFKVKNINFARFQYDIAGEYLETSFQIENLTNTPIELYAFVVATYEKEYIPKSSFESPDLEDKILIKNIKAYPDDLTNFEYTETDEKGVSQKVYQKYPKNIKAGMDQDTGKPYVINDMMIFRARHFSKYVKNYYFFNTITVLLFDADDEKLVFSQNYIVRPIKR